MITNRDIVVVGLQSFDLEIGSNCRNIALEFARQNRVLYVNPPMDRKTYWKRNKNAVEKNQYDQYHSHSDSLVNVDANLWKLYPHTLLESITTLPVPSLFRFLNRINNKRFARQIRKAIDRLGFKNILVFNDSDMFRSFYLDELLKPDLYVYYTRDNLLALDFWKTNGASMEPALMAKADLVFANSTYLTQLAARHNPESHYVGQGCDLTLYDAKLLQSVPEDLATIPHPVIGYTGALFALRLDIEVLEYIARNRPDWSLVLIGPEDEAFKNSSLHKLPNVHFLGNKKPEALPSYVGGFDVAINPQRLNEVTRGNYPRKIDEYLAMGKPTVATKTEAMSVFAAHTSLAQNAAEYVELIEQALMEKNPQLASEREAFARAHTWEQSVQIMHEHMERKLNQKTKPCH